jgi:drug/metabolite transporter (DMT)-like permease
MPYLVIVSLIWAFSFGLIKDRLVGLDSAFISAARLGLALVVFLPFFRWRGLNAPLAAKLFAIGALQFGVMYLAYNESFRHLQAYEVALFTLTTPIFVTILADALDRTFRPRAFAAAMLAVIGTSIAILRDADIGATVTGLLLVQLSNASFAGGLVWYRKVRARHPELKDRAIFALPYAGACLVAVAAFALPGRPLDVTLTSSQLLTLLYLGVVASGLGFFLWNVGSARVSAGTAAVMNNAKIPLGIAVSLLFFGETANLLQLAPRAWRSSVSPCGSRRKSSAAPRARRLRRYTSSRRVASCSRCIARETISSVGPSTSRRIFGSVPE